MAGASAEELQDTADRDMERQALVYALGQWLVPYHHLLVHAWVDQFFNGGITVTSRGEGAHRVLKQWIGPPSQDLDQV